MRKSIITLVLAMFVMSFAAGAVAVPPAKSVKPILECVEPNDIGTYTAHFGYLNENDYNVDIPVGADNKFTPTPQDRGQPTTFMPGRTGYYPNSAFTVDFDGSELVWTLTGPDGQTRTATASDNPAQLCSDDEIPEFGAIGAAAALVGALAVFAVARKKR